MDRVRLVSLGMLATMSNLALAQNAERSNVSRTGLEEVTVTAAKTGAQSLQEVPLAIQAFDGESLKERNIATIDDLVTAIPGAFEGQRQSVASRSYNLRGAGGSNANGDSPIGYYLDDVPFIVTNFGIAPPVRFIDIERVEVLRGPQGTLYGQGSSGGVFIFHSRDPDLNDFKFIGEAEVGSTEGADSMNYGVAGAVSIPLLQDRLAVRISGGHSYNPGWADAYNGLYDGTPDRKGVNEVNDDDIRVAALFKPTDNISLHGQYWKFRPRQGFTGNLASVSGSYYQNTAGQNSFADGNFELWSFTANIDFESFSITSATSDLKGHFGINIPQSPSGFFSSQFYPEMFAQELRAYSTGAGPLHWVVGASYQDGEGPQDNQLERPGVSIDADNNTLTENYAFFGEVSYDLFDGKLVPLLGLRTYHDKRTFEDATSSLESTKDVDTWRVNLSWLPTDDLTMFVTASTGFRAGIVQSQVQAESLRLAGVPADIALEPETSKNYEVGLKWRLPSRDLSIGLNLYQTEYKNLQTNTPGGIVGVNGFSNFGDATSKGLDYEIQWHTPLEGLIVGWVGNANKSEFDRVAPAVQAALPLFRPGSRMVNSIQRTSRLDVSYSTSFTDALEGFGNVGYGQVGNRLQSIGQYADSYSLINATLGVRLGAYEVALIGDNLTDERGPSIIGNAGRDSGAGPTPRTVGLRFRADFQ
ncbi:TonB-dependent receptor [Peristeroidobacter soli]|uniref:TonB-dependent receptor n=1 Tax=Peristeroidobacter soli TaxID=2497877 RepID=UPI001C37C9E1|nr:TonB-dependent receptor [Peristeroidobacter soli]